MTGADTVFVVRNGGSILTVTESLPDAAAYAVDRVPDSTLADAGTYLCAFPLGYTTAPGGGGPVDETVLCTVDKLLDAVADDTATACENVLEGLHAEMAGGDV